MVKIGLIECIYTPIKFKSNLPNDFNKLGFEISRNFDI